MLLANTLEGMGGGGGGGRRTQGRWRPFVYVDTAINGLSSSDFVACLPADCFL